MSFEQELIQVRDAAAQAKAAAFANMLAANDAAFEAAATSGPAWEAASKAADEAARAFEEATEAAHAAVMDLLKWRTAGSAAGALISTARWAALSR